MDSTPEDYDISYMGRIAPTGYDTSFMGLITPEGYDISEAGNGATILAAASSHTAHDAIFTAGGTAVTGDHMRNAKGTAGITSAPSDGDSLFEPGLLDRVVVDNVRAEEKNNTTNTQPSNLDTQPPNTRDTTDILKHDEEKVNIKPIVCKVGISSESTFEISSESTQNFGISSESTLSNSLVNPLVNLVTQDNFISSASTVAPRGWEAETDDAPIDQEAYEESETNDKIDENPFESEPEEMITGELQNETSKLLSKLSKDARFAERRTDKDLLKAAKEKWHSKVEEDPSEIASRPYLPYAETNSETLKVIPLNTSDARTHSNEPRRPIRSRKNQTARSVSYSPPRPSPGWEEAPGVPKSGMFIKLLDRVRQNARESDSRKSSAWKTFLELSAATEAKTSVAAASGARSSSD
jgi:hypothetical protein